MDEKEKDLELVISGYQLGVDVTKKIDRLAKTNLYLTLALIACGIVIFKQDKELSEKEVKTKEKKD